MHRNFLALIFLAFSPLLVAQLAPRNEDIVKMVRAGLGEDLIITTINASPGYYDTSVAGLAALKTAGVTDKVLSALVHKAFQICFAGTGQDQVQGLTLGQMEKLLQDTGCGPQHSAVPPLSAQVAPVPNASVPAPVAAAPCPVVALAAAIQAPAEPSSAPARSASKPRVFLALASTEAGQGTPQDQATQISKEFAQNCPGVQVASNQNMTDYTVRLSPVEDGAAHDPQFRVANKDGSLISNTNEGVAIGDGVKKACNAILADWAGK